MLREKTIAIWFEEVKQLLRDDDKKDIELALTCCERARLETEYDVLCAILKG